ncbi:MAG: PilW family protein [Colwellia sp.]|nr:PilW family protein [Colwellia sp.]MCW9080097.1 PilW family protein [Colwellia sp.]
MNNYQKGFTLLELFISLAVGLVLFAGVLSIFVGLKTTSSETSSAGTLQENGRFVLSVLTDDLLREGFWGDMPSQLTANSLSAIPVIAGPDCVGQGINNASFPQAVGYFRSIWGMTAANTNAMGCIADASVGSDILQLKRVLSIPIVGATDVTQYFLNTNTTTGTLFSGVGAAAPPFVSNGRVWEYQHHVYYIRNEAQGAATVPVLMQGVLSVNNGMSFSPLVDGIEVIRFMYGVDADDDGDVDAFISANNMTQAFWNKNNSNILAVKIYVLARDILPDNNYTNTNTYQLGDLPVVVNDNYRRLLFTTTVTLYNARVDTWP